MNGCTPKADELCKLAPHPDATPTAHDAGYGVSLLD